MRNPSYKKQSQGASINKAQRSQLRSEFFKNELNKLFFRKYIPMKNEDDLDKQVKTCKHSKNLQINRTRNHLINKKGDESSKYLSTKTNKQNTIDKNTQKDKQSYLTQMIPKQDSSDNKIDNFLNDKSDSLAQILNNQKKQLEKLSDFYQRDNDLNKKYSLFDFPDFDNNKTKRKNNNQIPTEYFNDFLQTYCREENCLEFKVKPNFIESQADVNCRMRAIVVNWMIEVHDRFKLLPDTLFLAVIILDRYMSAITKIKKNRLQLIAVTALLVACKYEEIFSPEVRDFVCILDRTYEREDLMEQENQMMKVLKFELTFPTSLRYFEVLRELYSINQKYNHIALFLLELTLIDCRFSKYSQATVATTITFILMKIYYNYSFDKFIDNSIKIPENTIKECLIDIFFLYENIENSIYSSIPKKHKNAILELKKIIVKKIE